MDKIIVTGGNTIQGEVTISGAKNAVLPIIIGTLLAEEGICVINEVPHLADVETIMEVLECLGAKVTLEGSTMTVDSTGINNFEAPYHYIQKMRASLWIMGPLLARLGRAKISMPGGCAIGTRPIDLHLKGLEALGATINIDHGNMDAKAEGRLKGAKIYLDFPSVGATEHIMMAAVIAEGTTIIENAAEEPEVVDLANFLNSMGANVRGAGTKVIKVEGVEKLHGTNYTVIPDRIEAGSYLIAAAITGGNLLLKNVIADHIKPVIAKLQECGMEIV
ncbi:MAG: UDP-N-acetylglucosamine 1-carboxyvinyltransferase, partial [Peptococcaceae bacterium]|nr:UDP-N-acetylglucosamine 1-carboxyvinyltransferase [Peptococcaceae bacterium]